MSKIETALYSQNRRANIQQWVLKLSTLVTIGLAGAASAQRGPIYLSTQQFLDARFPESVGSMIPAVRSQLQATNPSAATDTGPINWATVDLKIIAFGKPTLVFKEVTWHPEGSLSPPVVSAVAAEAYFNCSTQPSERNLAQSDIRTTEAETSRTQSQSSTNRVKAAVSVNYSSPTGGLGGDASLEWERTIVKSDEFMSRTKETLQVTNETSQKITVIPLSVRFYEYSTKTEKSSYSVTARALVDTQVAAIVTRPAFGKRQSVDIGAYKTVFNVRVPAKDFQFDLGYWSYYYPDGPRSLEPRATVEVVRETTFMGPVEIVFSSVQQCYNARTELQSKGGDVSALINQIRQIANDTTSSQ